MSGDGWPPAIEAWMVELRAAAFDHVGDSAQPNPTGYIAELRWYADPATVDADPDDDGLAELRRARAQQELDRIETRGAREILREWYKAQHGRLPVPTVNGERRKARAGGVVTLTDTGGREHQLALFELMTFAQLARVLATERSTVIGHQAQVTYVTRLLALQTAAALPDTATPAQAAQVLGTTVDAWVAA